MNNTILKDRFRGFLPVVIDVETGGFNSATDALLELAAVYISINEQGIFFPEKTLHLHITPFLGANIEQAALEFTGIDPYHPFRFATEEKEAMLKLCSTTRQSLQTTNCSRAILVGHNAHFDLSFLQAAFKRNKLNRSPFHSFTVFDTASLSALAFGQTVLAKALKCAKIDFDPKRAHGALYDAKKTAELFCKIVNTWEMIRG